MPSGLSRVNPEELFAVAHGDLRCNTSYPPFKELFREYLGAEDLFSDVDRLSYYIHVPFCTRLCSFCEYTRFLANDPARERGYLRLLADQVKRFLSTHDIRQVYGLDIGGGTPTALQDEEFSMLLDIADLLSPATPDEGFEKSIEISFPTATERKLELIREHGFSRISGGLQSADAGIMRTSGRDHAGLDAMLSVLEWASALGIEKVNIDLMYGMKGQTAQSLKNTLDAIRVVRPQQVTLYEMRYNSFAQVPAGITRDTLYEQYAHLFEGLSGMGYHASFGQNAFSLDAEDDGVSSYLKHRMLDGAPYKGFGIAAQSMSDKGISYGTLKGSRERTMPEVNALGEEYVYLLPGEELAAKYVSIALYGGRFKLSALTRLAGAEARTCYGEELAFLERRGYVSIEDDMVTVTREGFRYYGAIAALFWSREQQRGLLRKHGIV